MAKFTQENRPMAVTTPLGKDILLLEHFGGEEKISELFHFQMILLASVEDIDKVKFDGILGKKVTIEIKGPKEARYFNGVVQRFSQVQRVDGPEGPKTFLRFRAEIVPELWFWTKKVQSRIFQQLDVVEILKKVFTGLDVSYSDLSGAFPKRDYCTQYRESDFDFASRLMEEEGIFYYFKHTKDGHQMILANTPKSHPLLGTINFEEIAGADRPDERVSSWIKYQEIRSGKISLRDYSFEKYEEFQNATKSATGTTQAGKVVHKLNLANEKLEIYNFPADFAKRFDGVDPGGKDQPGELSKFSDDGERVANIRLQEEIVGSLNIEGRGDCRLFYAGSKFALKKHFDADGNYVITRVNHDASVEGSYTTSGSDIEFSYENRFSCIPVDLPFRPVRKTPKARIDGTQTAEVVGPKGEEIFTDKYSRVKVQFHWDRDGKKDANSSCWVRVATSWAGKQWGLYHIPRIGQEVVVAFEEGDPDQPIIVGNVFNATNMPPYKLPDFKTQSGLKTRSTLQGTTEQFNELRFEDKKDAEDIYFHAQKDFHRVVENDDDLKVLHDQTIEIKNDRTETIKEGNEKITIEKGKRTETLKQGDEEVTLEKGKRTHKIKSDDNLTVEGKRTLEVTQDHSLTVKQGNYTLEVKLGKISIKATAGAIAEEAVQSIELKVGANSIKIDPVGVTIKGTIVKIEGSAMLQAKAPMTQVSGDGMLMLKGGVIMIG